MGGHGSQSGTGRHSTARGWRLGGAFPGGLRGARARTRRSTGRGRRVAGGGVRSFATDLAGSLASAVPEDTEDNDDGEE